MNDNPLNILWQFLRHDMPVGDFERWLYAEAGLESLLGEALHFELISTDFTNRDDVFLVSQKLEALLRTSLACECITLKDRDVVPMGCDGRDKRFFASVETVRKHGGDQWWLSLDRCGTCGQNWMIATEERIYDDYFIRRLDTETAGQVLNNGVWPDDFMTYEKVLEEGLKLSKACRFHDPMAGSLVWTAQDLKAARPDITTAEISELLGTDVEHVESLLASAR